MFSNTSTSLVNASAFAVNKTLAINGSWSGTVAVMTVVHIATILTNGIALLLFAIEKELRTSFTVYIINLQCVTFLQSAVNGFFYVSKSYYQKWMYSDAACTLYLYVHWVISPWQSNCHVLITLNRLWAVTFPVSYRHYHNKKVAVTICLGMCLFAHSYTLPRWILDLLYYRPPTEKYPCVMYCYIMPFMNGMCSVIHFMEMVDEAVILISFLYIWYKHTRRQRIKPTGMATIALSEWRTEAVIVGANGEIVEAPKRVANNESSTRKNSSAFTVLAIMTSSVLVFWTPSIVNNILSVTSHYYSLSLNGAFGIMFFAECALDPIFFMLAVKGSKRAFKRLFCSLR